MWTQGRFHFCCQSCAAASFLQLTDPDVLASPYFHGQGSGIKMGLRKFYSWWLERLGDARFVVGGAA